MKKPLFLLMILLLTLPTMAQLQKGVVYLKNGSQIKGKYQYVNDKSQIKLIANQNIYIVDTADIKEITNRKKSIQDHDVSSQSEPLKYFFNIETGVLFGNSDDSQSAPLSFMPSFNYAIDKRVSIGIGSGLEFLKESYVPVYLNIQYNLRNNKSTPYLFVKGGYSFAAEETNEVRYDYRYDIIAPQQAYYNKLDAKGGWLFNSGLGYKYMHSSNFGMSLAFGYRFQRLTYKDNSDDDSLKDYKLHLDYNRLSLHLGFIF